MTWYWWTHWFWITILSVLITATQLSIVQTYPISPTFGNNKEYNVDKQPLKFPIAAQTDVEDVFIGGDEILTAVFRDSRYLRSKDAERNSNSKLSDNIAVDRKTNVSEVNLNINYNNNNNSGGGTTTATINSTIVAANRTKGVDVNSNITNLSLISSTQSTKIETTSLSSSSSSSSLLLLSSLSPPSHVLNHGDDLTENSSLNSTAQTTILNNSTVVNEDYETENSNNNTNSNSSEDSNHQTNNNNNNNNNNKTSVFNVNFVDEIKPLRRQFGLENITEREEVIRAEIERRLDGERGRKSKVLAEYRQELKSINFSESKNLLARSAAISLDDFEEGDEGNISSEALSVQRAYILDAGAISGICLAVFGLCSGIAIAGIAIYRRRYLNKPQTLSEPDSSGYIDDSTIRDNSDEMYSLDNDSFLNSLEAMTIQNYWTDTVKHTKL